MKQSEINTEAIEIINMIFHTLKRNTDRRQWKTALDFIQTKISILETWTRWNEMFIWKQVLRIMSDRYWKKFIKK